MPFLPAVIVGASLLALLYLIYSALLPKPIPGIPYNERAVTRLLGDIPAMREHIAGTDGGTIVTYIQEVMRTLNAPLPMLVLGDFHETRDISIRRDKEFDRAHTLGNKVRGLAPNHHIHLKTTSTWIAQRQLIQDLMTPSFLYNIAGPVIHEHVCTMIELWRMKSTIAKGRPWHAADDINHIALDAVMAFSFGGMSKHNATQPTLEAVQTMMGVEMAGSADTHFNIDKPVSFPRENMDDVLQAILDLTETVGELQDNPLPPGLTWAYIMRRPRIRKATRTVERLHHNKEKEVRSALEHMVRRESTLAEKEGRPPNYFSRTIIDEAFGFVFAGHETTSTTLCWALKFLADQPQAQLKLRSALECGFLVAAAQRRQPTIQEITSVKIPYLDTTMEEILRFAGTGPVVDREALVDTEIFGHRIPKGTVVTCLVTGPSMLSPGFDVDPARRSASSREAEQNSHTQSRTWDRSDISVFNHDRWIVSDAEKGDQFNPAAGPQLAFGLGARGCYGRRLVYLEMRVLLTLVLWSFELLPCPRDLSGYHASLITTNEPKQCYVRLREVDKQ
ncbi:hypothetical protein BDV06DRAFT_234057 [Aspergillus oleicola]